MEGLNGSVVNITVDLLAPRPRCSVHTDRILLCLACPIHLDACRPPLAGEEGCSKVEGMGDKAIISEILEASHLTDTYGQLTAKNLLTTLKKKEEKEGSSVRYEGLDEDRDEGRTDFGSIGEGVDRDVAGFTVDQAVDRLGFGKFQVKLSLLTGFAWMADAMEMMILSILSPALHCEWWITSFDEAMITTVVFCGMMLSSTMWGNICDKYGRKTGLVLCSLLTFVFGSMSALAPTFHWLLILRGLTGFGIGGVPQSVTLYAEFLPSVQRAKCVVLIESFWAIGAVFESLLALLIMEALGWRWLLAISSLPLLIFSLCCVWLPESPRYDVARGRPDLAYATLQRVASENGVQLPPGKLIDSSSVDDNRRGRVADLFIPELRRTTLLLWFIWCTNAFSYYGVVLFTTELFQSSDACHGGSGVHTEASCPLECHILTRDDYMDLLWTTLSEFPGLLITAGVIEWVGRKRTMAMEFGVFSFFIFLQFFCLNRKFVTAFIFIARAFISGAFQAAYVYTPEVYPTTLRAIGLGAASGFARLGAIVTPFVAQVASETSLYIPIAIYGTAGLFGVIAALLLPIETKGRGMTDTHH
uniref:Major facilitator superfamily (MFS) profile domain-containing protein n=1 Tax=Plectus sambesii TaxID=2011161 RepID=A0A914VPD8_9BILA